MAQDSVVDVVVGEVGVAGWDAGREEVLFEGVRGRLESMIGWARSERALVLEHAELEERVLAEGLELLRVFAEAHMAVRTGREQRRADVVDADGDVRVRVEEAQVHTRLMVFGPVRTGRMAYRRYRRGNLYPADREANWATGHSFSAGVVKRAAAAAALVPFERAAGQVSAATAITLGKRQAEELAVGAAADFDAFYAARRPRPCAGDVGLMITADGSALSVLPVALRPATAKAAAARAAAATGWPCEGELRQSKKRSAELVGVADIAPVAHGSGDILTALFAPTRKTSGGSAAPAGDDGAGPGRPQGPRAAGKTLFASVVHPIAHMIGAGFAEAHRRDPDHLRSWFALVDGNNTQIEAINACAARHRVKVPILIDVMHVIGYLWKAAGSFFDHGDPAARQWVREQTAKILDGRARDVWIGIRRRATTFGYRGAERQGADSCATYLENKKDYLDYPGFLAAGRPIATGLIEGAARWLVKDRMEVTGARWGLDGAEAVLRLRALVGNGDFEEYFAFHLKQEKHRNHDSRYHQPVAA